MKSSEKWLRVGKSGEKLGKVAKSGETNFGVINIRRWHNYKSS